MKCFQRILIILNNTKSVSFIIIEVVGGATGFAIEFLSII